MSVADPDDRALAAALVERRDDRAFSALYDRHTPALYQLALRLAAGDAAAADEIVHDAWVRAVDRLATFAWRSALRTWLSGFVVNRAREHVRDRHRSGMSLDDIALPVEDAVLARTFDRMELEAALAGLSAGYREVLILHDIEGYTHEEVGRMLGIEAGTSKSQLSRARRAMRHALGVPEGARHDRP